MALTQVSSSLLANTGVTPGSYGGSSFSPLITVNAEGQVTNISNVAFTGSLTAGNGSVLLASNTVTSNVTVNSGFNALSIGPITVASGNTVTVAAGYRWIII